MATCSPRKIIRKWVSDSREEDVMSELPIEIKERILEWLPSLDAARTALLSTQWRDVWLGYQKTQIVFDDDFVGWCVRKRRALVDMINRILYHHLGPVKKFTLLFIDYCKPMRMPHQSALHSWFLFLSRNGIEELDISILYPGHKYKLPSCIVSCPTIKHLTLCFFIFDHQINNAGCIFPCVTSLVFKHVDFKGSVKGIVYSIPNLEKLTFDSCEGINNFRICSPKLESLSIIGYRYDVGLRWFKLELPFEAVKVLCLDASLLLCKNSKVAALKFPATINLQVIKLYNLCFDSGELTGAMQLLKKSPNLHELEIIASNSPYSPEDIEVGLLEDPDQDLKMLNTLKIEWFSGFIHEMLFVKMLLSKCPALEKVVIQESYNADGPMALKILSELLYFPCASPKAQIVCMDWKRKYKLVDYPEF